MTYIPPTVGVPLSLPLGGGGPNPLLLQKRKTKKAFVPGFAGRFETDESVVSSVHSPSSLPRSDVPDVPNPITSSTKKDDEAIPELKEEIQTELNEQSNEAEKTEERVNIGDEKIQSVDSSNEVTDESRRKKVLANRQHDLLLKQTNLMERINNLESQQNELCGFERFEEAESIDSEISHLRESLLELNNEYYVEIPSQISDINSRIETLTKTAIAEKNAQVVQILGKINGKTQELETARESLLKDLVRAREIDGKFRDRDSALKEREIDLMKRSDEIEEKILHESKAIEAENFEAESKISELDSLISDLQKQLSEAINKRSEYAISLSGNQLKLKSIRVQFSTQLEELEDDRARFEESKCELIALKSSEGGGNVENLEEQLQRLESELESVKNSDQTNHIEKEIFDMTLLLDRQGKWEAELTEIKASIDPARTALIEASQLTSFLNDTYKQSEAQLDNFRTRIRLLEDKVPLMEAEKAAAIADRAFKEAKELSVELKSITEEISGAESRLSDLKKAVKANRSELNKAICAESEIKETLKNLEVEFSQSFIRHFNNRKEDLLAAKNLVTTTTVLCHIDLEIEHCNICIPTPPSCALDSC